MIGLSAEPVRKPAANERQVIGKVPKIAAEIARRLLAAGRPGEALKTIEATEHRRSGWRDFEWEDARIDVLGHSGVATRRKPPAGPASNAPCLRDICVTT